MARTLGPTATTSAQASRFDICAVAGMRMPPEVRRSLSASSFTRMRSFSILIGSLSLPLSSGTAWTVPALGAHGDAAGGHGRLGLADGVLAEVEDRRGEHGV